jgi:hypothetical protein
VASFPARLTRHTCECGLPNVVHFPRGGAFVFVWEYLHPSRRMLARTPDRPTSVHLPAVGKVRKTCDGPTDTYAFKDAGRVFQLELYRGPAVTPLRRRKVAAMLDSFRVGSSLVSPSTTATSSAREYRPLTSILSVLRRPQTGADRNVQLLRILRGQAHSRELSVLDGKPVVSLVRLAGVTPWGVNVFLVPVRPLDRHEIARLPARQRAIAGRTTPALSIYAAGLTSGYLSAPMIDGGSDFANSATGKTDQYLMVVPDGVAKVALWNTMSIRAHPRALVPPHAKPIIVTVHHNIAAFRSQHFVSAGHEIWYGPSGKVVKRIANAPSCGPLLGSCA